nr:MAG TPA: hypothetical protein [Caudoviricetes sp.]
MTRTYVCDIIHIVKFTSKKEDLLDHRCWRTS